MLTFALTDAMKQAAVCVSVKFMLTIIRDSSVLTLCLHYPFILGDGKLLMKTQLA